MTLNPNFILRELAGQSLLVSIVDGENNKRLLYLNDIGKDIYLHLREGLFGDALIAALITEYDVEEEALRADVEEFLGTLRSQGIVED